MVRGVVFKLAADPRLSNGKHLYSADSEPNYEYSAKAAGSELRATTCYLGCESANVKDGLCLPMTAVRADVCALIADESTCWQCVDYRGFRLLAMPLLPVENTPVLFGSDDGGQSVHARDSRVNELMASAGKELHLA